MLLNRELPLILLQNYISLLEFNRNSLMKKTFFSLLQALEIKVSTWIIRLE